MRRLFLGTATVLLATRLVGQTPLVDEGDTWYFLRGREAPPIDWATWDFDPIDAGWEVGATGIGYMSATDAPIWVSGQQHNRGLAVS